MCLKSQLLIKQKALRIVPMSERENLYFFLDQNPVLLRHLFLITFSHVFTDHYFLSLFFNKSSKIQQSFSETENILFKDNKRNSESYYS